MFVRKISLIVILLAPTEGVSLWDRKVVPLGILGIVPLVSSMIVSALHLNVVFIEVGQSYKQCYND